MKSHVKELGLAQEGTDCGAVGVNPEEDHAWVRARPALRFQELLNVMPVGRSKTYELMKSDPEFPQGIPLFDSDSSPRFWWSHQVLAWLKGREEKFKRKKETRQ